MNTGKPSVNKQINVNADSSGSPPLNAAFSTDLNWFVANYGSSIHIQRLSDGVTTNTLGPFSDPISAVAFSSDSTLLAAASNSTINVWQTANFTQVKSFAIPNTSEPVHFLTFSWDGKSLAAFSDTLRVWQMNADKPTEAKTAGLITGYRGAFSFTSDSSGVMLAQLDGSVRQYGMPDGALQSSLNLPDLNSKGMAFSPDRSMVAAISGNKAYVWRTSDGKQVAEMDGQRAMNGGLAFSPDSKYLAAPGQDKTIVVWRMSDQTILGTVTCPDAAWNVVFSPDGALLAAITSGVISIFQLSDGKLRYQVNGYSLAFSADGKTLAVAYGNYDSARITLYNSADGKAIKEIDSDGGSLAFSPDGKLLAVGGNSLLLLQTSDGKLVKSLGNPAPFGPLVFSPDGKLLGTAGWDGRVFLWGEE
jgi:WD40 repeat protein